MFLWRLSKDRVSTVYNDDKTRLRRFDVSHGNFTILLDRRKSILSNCFSYGTGEGEGAQCVAV